MPLSTEGTWAKFTTVSRTWLAPKLPQLLGTARICLILMTKAQVYSRSVLDVTSSDSTSGAKTQSSPKPPEPGMRRYPKAGGWVRARSKQAVSPTMPLSSKQMSLHKAEEEVDMVLSGTCHPCSVLHGERWAQGGLSGTGHAHWEGNPPRTKHEKPLLRGTL